MIIFQIAIEQKYLHVLSYVVTFIMFHVDFGEFRFAHNEAIIGKTLSELENGGVSKVIL